MGKRTTDDFVRDIEVRLKPAMDNAYQIIGTELSEYMRDQVDQFADGERLKSSITYSTEYGVVGATTGKSPASYLISKANAGELKIGTAAPFAKYVEWGAMPFGAGIGSEDPEAPGGFNERITAWWCDERGHGRSDEQLAIARAIATSIVKNGTRPNPFFTPTVVKADSVVSSALRKSLQKLGIDLQKACKTKIEINVDLMKGTKAG